MNFSKRVFIFSIFVISVICSGPACALEAGEAAPDFRLKSITGEQVRLSDFKGRVVLLKLATTWCPTCKQLSDEISRAGDDLAASNVVFLDVFVRDSKATVEEYVAGAAHPMTFHALLDDGQVYEAYNVYLIPRLLLVDADQVVRFDSAGRNVSAEDIKAMVREHLPPAAEQGS
jgi:peroxiredoxin